MIVKRIIPFMIAMTLMVAISSCGSSREATSSNSLDELNRALSSGKPTFVDVTSDT